MTVAAHSQQSWFEPALTQGPLQPFSNSPEFERLWRGFMTARVTLGLVLLALQGGLYAVGQAPNNILIVVCAAYFMFSFAGRLLIRPRPLGPAIDLQWLATVGLDVLAFGVLQFIQGSNINYTPLFALPVLFASVLGTLSLALGSAAGVTLLLLFHAAWLSILYPIDTTPHFVQSALTGVGSFVIAFLANQISARLASEEQRSRKNQLAAQTQQQVNELVIESLTDGILVVDQQRMVHAVNPAARMMLAHESRPLPRTPFSLNDEIGWVSLKDLARETFLKGSTQLGEVNIDHEGQGTRLMHVRTRLTPAQNDSEQSLCVMFVQDQRELEARMRTEKLASMGRMSAAVAHEIRNPLSAIAQANALLDEDISDPKLKKLTSMVQQNASRLDRIVEDVLNVSRAQNQPHSFDPQCLNLNDEVEKICKDWGAQTLSLPMLRIDLTRSLTEVNFESEHLRRVLINLLDNAKRYASQEMGCVQVGTRILSNRNIVLSVWSDGKPLDASVQQHLFEPFFSSESRSSGLGLYICRELCQGHGASISYQRSKRILNDMHVEGNDFFISMLPFRPAK